MTQVRKLLIVGGVAGGASAAARARRLSEDAEIVLFERGEHVSFANCGLPYFIGGEIQQRDRLLVQTPEALRKRFRLDVRVRTEVTAIDAARREVTARDLATGREYREAYDALILSPGAAPIRPPILGADGPRVLTLRNLGDMDRIQAAVEQAGGQGAIVVGGGYIGLEMAEALRRRDVAVTLVELLPQVMAPADAEMVTPIHQELRLHGVDLRLGTSVTRFDAAGDGIVASLSNGDTVTAGLAILAVGVRPDVPLALATGLRLGERGGIAVDAHMRTSDPHIYAVGDAVEVTDFVTHAPALLPLAGPANRQGRIAADNVFGRATAYKATQGTAICKVFGLAIAMTGQSEKALRRAGVACEKVYVHPANHATYYPGASPISLKVLFAPGSGRVLGAQAVGAEGVDKRIDVLAMAVRAGLTVYDLEDAELCYAPPYGSARDPINYAGFVAANSLRGDVRLCHTEDMADPATNQILLDVRTPAEVAAGTIPGSRNIPVDALRGRLDELPRDKEILVFCQVGLRGYLACRILEQHGLRCRNLTGGYKTYQMAVGHLSQPPATPKEMRDDAGNDATGGSGDARGSGATPPAGPTGQSGTGQSQAGPQPQAHRSAPNSAPVGVLPEVTIAAPDARPPQAEPRVTHRVDARGLLCPGPVQQLKAAIDAASEGEAVRIAATDPSFAADVPAWCHTTGHELVELAVHDNAYEALVVKRTAPAATTMAAPAGRPMTIVVFSSDFDRAMAAFIIANGAASMGYRPTLFFTFWGLNILRRGGPVVVRKSLIERMFGWMMPRGPERLTLSKMNMAGMGLGMIKGIMRKKNVASLPELIASAVESGVRLVACSMSMSLMGLRREEFVDGVEEGGVALYLDHAGAGTVNLFI